MSAPSPNFRQLQQSLYQFIAYQESKLNILDPIYSEDRDRVSGVFRSIFDEMGAKILGNGDLSNRDIEQLAEKMNLSAHSIVASDFFKSMDVLDQEKYLNIVFALKEELHSFQELTLHKAEINEKGLEYFLDQQWAWKQLEQLAKIGNSWAINTFKRLVRDNDHKASLFVIYNSSILAPQHQLFEVKDFLIPYLEDMLRTNEEEDRLTVYIFVETILNNEDWSWGVKFLKERFDTDSLAASISRDIFLAKVGTAHGIHSCILEKLLQDHPVALDSVAVIFGNHPLQAEQLVEPLIRLALEKGHFHFDILLLSLAAFSDCSLCDRVEEILDVLESKRTPERSYYSKILDRLINKRLELLQNFDEFFPCETNIWVHQFDFVTIRTYQLFALRYYRLMECIERGLVYREEMEPVLDCFPKMNAVMVGSGEGYEYFFKEISKLLIPHQIAVYSTAHQADLSAIECRSQDNPLLESDRSISIWLRDYFFVNQRVDGSVKRNVFQYPYWKRLGDDFLDLTYSRLEDLFEDDPEKMELKNAEFHDLGTVADHQAQLNMLSYLLKADPHLASHQFQFTYNEGGNCLIGEFQGKPYALIGKNALDLNRIVLGEELEYLGFIKDSKGQWVQEDKLKEGELEEEDRDLNNDEMRLLFALDLGVDPSRIYFVEQADYHLDTAMAILEGKIIILNDSMRAFKIVEEQCLEAQKSQGAKRRRVKEQDLIDSRLEILYDKSKKMKLVEDEAEADLIRDGFKVIRIAGVFEDILQDHPENHSSNLFNFLSLTTPEGKKIIISLGCSKEYQNVFKKVISENITDPVEIHFLDQEQSEFLLKNHGGIHCLTKCLPYKL